MASGSSGRDPAAEWPGSSKAQKTTTRSESISDRRDRETDVSNLTTAGSTNRQSFIADAEATSSGYYDSSRGLKRAGYGPYDANNRDDIGISSRSGDRSHNDYSGPYSGPYNRGDRNPGGRDYDQDNYGPSRYARRDDRNRHDGRHRRNHEDFGRNRGEYRSSYDDPRSRYRDGRSGSPRYYNAPHDRRSRSPSRLSTNQMSRFNDTDQLESRSKQPSAAASPNPVGSGQSADSRVTTKANTALAALAKKLAGEDNAAQDGDLNGAAGADENEVDDGDDAWAKLPKKRNVATADGIIPMRPTKRARIIGSAVTTTTDYVKSPQSPASVTAGPKKTKAELEAEEIERRRRKRAAAAGSLTASSAASPISLPASRFTTTASPSPAVLSPPNTSPLAVVGAHPSAHLPGAETTQQSRTAAVNEAPVNTRANDTIEMATSILSKPETSGAVSDSNAAAPSEMMSSATSMEARELSQSITGKIALEEQDEGDQQETDAQTNGAAPVKQGSNAVQKQVVTTVEPSDDQSTRKLATWKDEELDPEDDMFGDNFVAAPIVQEFEPNQAKRAIDETENAQGYYKVTIGEVIDGRYLVKDVLGSGTFAQVLRVFDKRENVTVAMKLFRKNDLLERMGRFEMRYLQDVADADRDGNKSHVIRLYRHFRVMGHLSLVMENMDMSLADYIRRVGLKGLESDRALPFPLIRTIAKPIFESLQFLLKHRWVHADIKPANILIDVETKVVKLGDLGTFHHIDESHMENRNAGTPLYQPPELHLVNKHDCSVDTWAVGCTLYQLFTGTTLLHEPADAHHLLQQIQEIRGPIGRKLLNDAEPAYLWSYFKNEGGIWRFKNPDTGTVQTFATAGPHDIRRKIMNAYKVLAKMPGYPATSAKEVQDFVDLIDQCLHLQPDRRIKPGDALKHPFFQGAYA